MKCFKFEKHGNYSLETQQCDLLDGKIIKEGDPLFEKVVPPLHFNCHSVLVPIVPNSKESEMIHEMEKLENKIRGTFHVPYRLL